MDYAREINPNFYILGELFTNSETLDNAFINQLGINALVRGKESIQKQENHDTWRELSDYWMPSFATD